MALDDHVRRYHIIQAAESALRFCEGMRKQEFLDDEKTQRAVLQCIEVIGEAASHVTESTRARLPDVPWVQIVGMRHRIAHLYFNIDSELVWEVVAKYLQPLVAHLRQWHRNIRNDDEIPRG